ncbi:glycosyltransferase family 8 protein [Providencia sneebia]|uniref:Glycosyl transferase family 8 C-terminal domain-containing protein n=1 Tax=Providencia sneebia DSM 19967 TaxID=1141660 RepID=K8WV53_9GAMM|nr:glycosyltransferase [Providencia sneebia]EKT61302.1 hypothetical protein OO7_01316 [Providencia sneebia DSM 19967]
MFFEESKILSNKFTYDYSECKLEKFNIIYGITENFLLGAVISMESIIKNNPDMSFNFHFFIEKISANNLHKLEQTAKQYQTTISVSLIDNNSLAFLPVTERWPYATFYRIIGFDLLSDKYDTVLYLDADVMCKGSLSELPNISLDNYYLAAVPDLKGLQDRGKKLKIINDSKYFNSGVMLANLKEWKKHDLTDKFFTSLSNNPNNSLFPDQDILNIIARDKVYYLNKNYNYLYGMDTEIKVKNLDYYKDKLTDDVKLIHYVGVSKPWHSWVNYPSAKFFIDIYNDSSWSTVPLEKANTPKQLKKKSSHERLQKKYILSIISHLSYISAKIKRKF